MHELYSDQFVKTVFAGVEKFYSILKKQQVKQTSPLNTALSGARAGTSNNFTGTEQQCGGEAAILELGGNRVGGGK